MASSSGESQGDPSCWVEGFSWDVCCHPGRGPRGNAVCWDGTFTFERCCGGATSSAPAPAPPPPSWASGIVAEHATGPGGVPISLMPAEFGLAALLALAFFALLVRCLQSPMAPAGMLGDGQRKDGGPSGLSEGDACLQRERRVKHFQQEKRPSGRGSREAAKQDHEPQKQRVKIY
eukprot:TRINITY_DN51982_c0_g1_i1.p1 TRINITY_DN51982_c0_g1~~TRINITY_DN51982_c0_g1_i1.p1  ORF type:complete len:183 (-),score=37.51 TRINITY_DN51982_c0_g1_i1:76-603(-)